MNIILSALARAAAYCRLVPLCSAIVLSVLGVPSYAQAPAGLYFVHVDHLNTPRAIYNAQQQLVWRWDQQEPFGNSPPDENPSGLGTFECNIRFAGQYFDRETNLAYNYFREFDPALGRYVQSDPIGLAGGLNTHRYARGIPLLLSDARGLATPHDFAAAQQVLREAFPTEFSKMPTRMTSADIPAQAMVDRDNRISVDSKLYGDNQTPVDSFVAANFVQTVAHEMIHANENPISRWFNERCRMSWPICWSHQDVDKRAEQMAERVWRDFLRRRDQLRDSVCMP